MGQLDGRVAIVTGAGAGIGREHALLMAAEGAKVVCNDLADAHSTVAEIIANGGQAVAVEGNIGDMAVGAALTDAAVDSFGDLHVLVNNAGIIRDAMIWNMTERDFDAVVNVHLKGTFSATQAAARYWRAQSKEGVTADRSIVNTSSGSGLHGNFGQWNYSACKAGLAIQVVNASRELGKFGVRANAIAPVARTAPVAATPGISELVGEPVDEDVFDRYNPKNISPLVAYLATESCDFTGQTFGVYGGYVGLYAGYSIAHEVRADRQWDVDEFATVLGSDTFPRSVETRRAGIPPVQGATK
ncbi:SDR family NAD(P)-dependent oxidoreductase [Rhodococcus opacus]|uniref:SDR family NAD(P)-dependent oxidoreductase n=1 Tax=Rhodococcus opacus TaxID=37919 RepID=UPI001C445590|nr:SDR family NAD(P)-dependent oxidoreductase [Rhodococcus opacus]MBV6761061.1 SDR family NAD(P)-dependent oxidoreductase [Rhodococcus opacus]